MAAEIKFYFDYRSPYSYLASTQLKKLCDRHEAKLTYIPLQILKVMELVNNTPTTITCEVKGQYARADLDRWVALYKVPFVRNPNMLSINADLMGQTTLAAFEVGVGESVLSAMWKGVWIDQQAFSNIEEIASYLSKQGINESANLVESAPEFETKLANNNAEAAENGVFGAPSFMVDDQLFFGNDRLQFLEDHLITNA